MPVELTKTLRRRVAVFGPGGRRTICVEIDAAGITLRGAGRKKKYTVGWQAIVKRALAGNANLTEEEWQDPLAIVCSPFNPQWRVGNAKMNG